MQQEAPRTPQMPRWMWWLILPGLVAWNIWLCYPDIH